MLAKQEHRVYPVSQVNTAIHPWHPPNVLCVQLVGRLVQVVLNVKFVKLEEQHTAISLVVIAKIVTLANIVPAA